MCWLGCTGSRVRPKTARKRWPHLRASTKRATISKRCGEAWRAMAPVPREREESVSSGFGHHHASRRTFLQLLGGAAAAAFTSRQLASAAGAKLPGISTNITFTDVTAQAGL